MNEFLEFLVSRSDALPQMDLSYHGSGGYNPISELMRAMILRTIEDFNSDGELHLEAVSYMEDPE